MARRYRNQQKRRHKNSFIGYDYIRREVTHQNVKFESINQKKIDLEKRKMAEEAAAKNKMTKQGSKGSKDANSKKPIKRKAGGKENDATDEK